MKEKLKVKRFTSEEAPQGNEEARYWLIREKINIQKHIQLKVHGHIQAILREGQTGVLGQCHPGIVDAGKRAFRCPKPCPKPIKNRLELQNVHGG